MIRSIVLDDSRVRSVIHNEAVGQEIPFLKRAFEQARKVTEAKARPNCGSCRRSAQSQAAAITAVKGAVAGLGQEDRSKLKRILGVDEVVVRYRSKSGRIITAKI